MTTNLRAGDTFPDFELLDHRNEPRRLSQFVKPSPLDEKLGFMDGYPFIVVFGRGFFCPRDQEQMRQLVRFRSEEFASWSGSKPLRVGDDQRRPSDGAGGISCGARSKLEGAAELDMYVSEARQGHFTTAPAECK
ncbi:MAG: hypothetical protein JOZ19_07185 [Rubrobacter sp.]|nr:hypothetical protein [Rubrobacter sp.]